MDSAMTVDRLKSFIRDVPDFPKKGIIFKDITPLLNEPEAYKEAIELLTEPFLKKQIDVVASIESRGFIFGSTMAYLLGCGFVPVRKMGKLPSKTHKISYALEYGEATLEMHVDAIKKGARVLIVDDVLATGGTAQAVAQLVEKLNAEVVGFSFLIELAFLKGRPLLKDYPVYSLIQY
jgi:adenine phosphoribosyltransferase